MVWRADIPTGAFSTLAAFPQIPNPLPFGPPALDAVPTGITYSNGQLLVTLFRGFPFPPGTSIVKQVDPLTGGQVEFITGLSSAIDVLSLKGKWDTDYLVLGFSKDFLGGQPGILLRFDTPGVAQGTIADCLITPTAMTLDEKTSTLYVTAHAQPGSVLVGAVTRRAAGDLFTWSEERPLELKGKAQPVSAFEAIGERLGTRAAIASVPMVGRERESSAHP